MKHFILSLCLLMAFRLAVQAEISLPAIFGDNMVLQQNTEVKIWVLPTAVQEFPSPAHGTTEHTKQRRTPAGNGLPLLRLLRQAVPTE